MKKFWRIYPELWLSFLVNTILIVSLYGMPRLKDFFLYCFTQLTFFQFYTGDWLRGYGVGTPNGALWTITVTIQFYIVAYFLYKISLSWKLKHWLILLVGSIVVAVLCSNLNFLPELILKLIGVSFIPYFYIFVTGIISYKYWDRFIPFLKKYWYLISIQYILLKVIFTYCQFGIKFGLLYDVFSSVFLAFSIIAIGYKFGMHRLRYEISYSIFLWHMIIVNICIEIAEKFSLSMENWGITFMCITFFGTIIVSFISTSFSKKVIKYIER